MAFRGMLHDHGAQELAGGMHYLTMTALGKEQLREYRDSIPKPKPLTRAQQRYRRWLNSGGYMPFGIWLSMEKGMR